MLFIKNLKSILISTFLVLTFLFSLSLAQGIGQINISLNGAPASDARIKAFGLTSTTDTSGNAKFDYILNGNQYIDVVYQGKEYYNTISITSSTVNLKLNDKGESFATSDSLNLKPDYSYVTIVCLASGAILILLGVKMLYDRVQNLDRRSKILAKKMELALGGFASFVFILGMFFQIFSVTNLSTNYQLNQNANASTDDVNCFCNVNICSNSCNFNKYSDSNYSSVIKCSKEEGISAAKSDQNTADLFCKRKDRTKGDSNGDNISDVLDYMYYVRVVNGGLVATEINPDFNGDGVVSRSDRDIIVKTILNK